ncbi:HAD family hydrolase [Brevibacterium litoralis]|uniref:HAD family hydrolase n=1 Tax=Brevibacterium litoralis TaxID=3138935 RepID=UPI0032EF9F16
MSATAPQTPGPEGTGPPSGRPDDGGPEGPTPLVRLVASDIDGTLLRHPAPLPEATVVAIRDVLDAGIEFLPVTGRPMRWLDAMVEADLGIRHVVCANGAVVYDVAAGRVEHASTVPAEDLAEFVAAVRESIPAARLAFETLEGMRMEPGFRREGEGHSRVPEVDPADGTALRDVVKVLLRTGDSDSDALLALVTGVQDRTAAGRSLHASHSNPSNGLVELAAAGVTKARTLATYCGTRGIGRAQVAAFGDMPNDLEMLRWAGHGYAMADGHPDAIAAAAHVAPALDEGGVAPVLHAFAAAVRAAR